MGTFINGMQMPPTEPIETPDINAAFTRLTNAFNAKKITKEEYRAKVAELVNTHNPNGKNSARAVGFIVARERQR